MINQLTKKAGRAWSNASALEKAGMVAGGVAAAPFVAAGGAAAPILSGAISSTAPGLSAALGARKFHRDRTKRPGHQLKEKLRADMERLAEGPQALQLSESEQRQMLQQSQEQANLAAQAQQANIAQQALAGGEFQQGAFIQAQQAAGEAAQQAAQEATANVQAANQARIGSESERIQADMAAREKRNREAVKFWSQFGVNLALSLFDKTTFAVDARTSAATGEQTQQRETGTTGTGTMFDSTAAGAPSLADGYAPGGTTGFGAEGPSFAAGFGR